MTLNLPNLILCFLTADEERNTLALKYWAIESDGKWTYQVQEIASEAAILKTKVAQEVRKVAVAYDLSNRCQSCSVPQVVGSRSELQLSSYQPAFICPTCQNVLTEERLRKEGELTRLQSERLIRILDRKVQEKVEYDYSDITYFDAVIVFALLTSSESAIRTGSIGNPYSLFVTPTNSLLGKLLARLHSRGILYFGHDTMLDAIDPSTPEHGPVSYYPLNIRWQLAPSRNGESFAKVFRTVGAVVDQRDECSDFKGAVAELWHLLAVDAATYSLSQELEKYRFFDVPTGEKTVEAFLYALKHFSIPQLRNFLYRIARDTAALSRRPEFHVRHALNTIPGNIIRITQRAVTEKWTVNPFCLKWDQEEAPLLTLFFDRVLGTGMVGFKSTTSAAFLESDTLAQV